MNGALDWKKASAGLLIALVFCLGWAGQDCPHEGPDHRQDMVPRFWEDLHEN